MFEPMDLKALTDDDLAGLLAGMRELALIKNRVALDLYCIIETEMMLRHKSVEIADYTDDEINTAAACLCCAVDDCRAAGFKDDYPAVQFLMLIITALVDQMEARGCLHQVQ